MDANAAASVAVRAGEARRGERSSGVERFAECKEEKGDGGWKVWVATTHRVEAKGGKAVLLFSRIEANGTYGTREKQPSRMHKRGHDE